MGGGQQAVDADLRARSEEHPVGIDQKDLAVGGEIAVNPARVVPQHPVERDAVHARLLEANQFLLGNGKALPIDNRFGGLLGNQGSDRIGPGDRGDAIGYLFARRTGQGGGGQQQGEG